MPKYETVIDARGSVGNTLVLAGCAGRMLRQLGEPAADITALYTAVLNAPSWRDGVDAVRVYFPVETDED